MYLIDANILLEVLYKRDRWRECYDLLNNIKGGSIKVHILHFTIHGISAILGKPELVKSFLSEIIGWRGLSIANVSVQEELIAAELADKVDLDFDDGLQYYYAKKENIPLVSFDRDFDRVDIVRIEPHEILKSPV